MVSCVHWKCDVCPNISRGSVLFLCLLLTSASSYRDPRRQVNIDSGGAVGLLTCAPRYN